MNLERRWPELLLPVGILACLFVIFVPLPPAIMDILLAANIAISVIILLTTLYIRTPLEFSVFPSMLLATTMARLALNIGTTRLILTGGASEGTSAAGSVIQSFGQFVAGDQIAVGLVIFAIIVIIQFVVITKGATRISEVAARFSLDGMPGRQMSIDSDLNSGMIDESTARRLRDELGANADFFGAMDGASKFVRGDAIAGIMITAVNIIGGLVVGLMAGMSISEAGSVFTMLTIGDGLVSQLPALLISIAAAMLVTRGTRESNLPLDSLNQVFAHPIVLAITAVFLGLMVFTELPTIPLLTLAVACAAGSWLLLKKETDQAKKLQLAKPKTKTNAEITIDKLLGNDVLEMELGVELICLADASRGGDLVPSVSQVRKRLAHELGVILPKIRIRDNLQLPPNQYRILVQGNPVELGTVYPDHLLAIDQGNASAPVTGAIAVETRDDRQAFWVDPESRREVVESGYRVLEPAKAIAERLSDLAFRQASFLLTRDATKQLIDETQKTTPAVVDELIPNILSISGLQKILKRLVSEKVSIRPMGLILEAIADHHPKTTDTIQLVEAVRKRLGPQIAAGLLGGEKSVSVFTISQELQTQILTSQNVDSDEISLELEPETIRELAQSLLSGAENLNNLGLPPVVLVRQRIRPAVRKIVSAIDCDIHVLGSEEVSPGLVNVIGEISVNVPDSESAAA